MSYECDKCGACCIHLIVEIAPVDLAREPRLKDVTKPFRIPVDMACEPDDEDEAEEYRRIGPLVPGWEAGAMLACGEKMPCPMLGQDKTCQIYATRPTCCVAMQAGSNQCQMARFAAGLAPLQPTEDD